MATELRDEELVEVLLNYGANTKVFNTDENKYAPLTIAAINGDHKIIELLLASGAPTNISDITYKWVPFIHAIKAGSMESVQLLLDHTTDYSIIYGLTIAAGEGNNPLVNLLLKQGATPHFIVRKNDEALGDLKVSALVPAVENGHEDIVEILIENGARPNGLGISDIYALDSAHLELPLDLAISKDNMNLVHLLLNKGADPNALTFIEAYPLETAINNRNEKAIIALLEAGAFVDVPSTEKDKTLLERLISEFNDSSAVMELLPSSKETNTVLKSLSLSTILKHNHFNTLIQSGQLPGIPFQIGIERQTIIDQLGSPDEADWYRGSEVYYYEACRCSFFFGDTDTTVGGIYLPYFNGNNSITPHDIIDILGPPSNEGINELEGGWFISYNFGKYSLIFDSPKESSPVYLVTYRVSNDH